MCWWGGGGGGGGGGLVVVVVLWLFWCSGVVVGGMDVNAGVGISVGGDIGCDDVGVDVGVVLLLLPVLSMFVVGCYCF